MFDMACGLGLADSHVERAVSRLTRFAFVGAIVDDPLQGLTVLVVDDDSDFQKSITRILRVAGAEVSVTGSVEGALQLLEANRWDVVVTDIGMPRLSGYDLIRRARERGHRLPMIAVTAFDTPEHRRQISRHGFAYHLTKPFDPDHLVAVVGETVRTGATHQI
jgi:CheY-like chemotaxis protein